MKKIFLGFFAAAALAVIIVTVSKINENQTISFQLGNIKKNISFEDLGVTGANSGFASIFSANKKFSVDNSKFVDSIIRLFPGLSSPEQASESFYIARRNQRVRPTFNARKLISQINNETENAEGSDIEIEIIPNDEEILETLPVYFTPEELHGKTFVLRAAGDDIEKKEWKIPMENTDWMTEDRGEFSINKDRLRAFLVENVAKAVERPRQDVVIKNFTDEGKAAKAEVTGVAKTGITFPVERNINKIESAMESGNFTVNIDIDVVQSRVINLTGIDMGKMDLIGFGRSNYAGSPEGRDVNIRKGLQKMNNIIVPPGATFSFNSFLGRLTPSEGWKNALGIFGGGSVAPTLGGGLCQVSTTVYRAAIAAGLPIIARRSHSLYVNYYKEYGEGLDATIFVGGQDLVFSNDTPSYMLIQAYDEGDDGYVKIFGTSDGRVTALDGPYHFDNVTPEKPYKPRKNEIAWFRLITWPDGRIKQETIVSRYKVVPHKR